MMISLQRWVDWKSWEVGKLVLEIKEVFLICVSIMVMAMRNAYKTARDDICCSWSLGSGYSCLVLEQHLW